MLREIQHNTGNVPVFTSHNAYTAFLDVEIWKAGNASRVNITKLFFDFDNERNPQKATDDLIKLVNWCEWEDIPIKCVFSGKI